MTNAYCDLATLKSAGALNINGATYDRRLLSLLEQASRLVDGYCNRHFYVLQATRQFEANWWSAGLQQLVVTDLIAAQSVRVAARFDGVASVPRWRTASYRLYPLDAAPEQPWGRPYTRMAIEPVCTPQCRRTDCHALVEVAGRWGYRQVTANTGATLAAEAMREGTTLMVSDGIGLSAGQTLSLGEEQVYVTGVEGTEVTVERGMNGSEAVAHASGAAIGVYRYPAPVVEACLHLAVQLWHTRDRAAVPSGTSRQGEGPQAGLGREVEALLSVYRKLAV